MNTCFIHKTRHAVILAKQKTGKQWIPICKQCRQTVIHDGHIEFKKLEEEESGPEVTSV